MRVIAATNRDLAARVREGVHLPPVELLALAGELGLPGLEIGAYAMVGMGSVVVASVPPHALVFGSPARVRGWVCVCGTPVVRGEDGDWQGPESRVCARCGRRYRLGGDDVRLMPEVA